MTCATRQHSRNRPAKFRVAQHIEVCGLRGEAYRIAQGLGFAARVNVAVFPAALWVLGGRATQPTNFDVLRHADFAWHEIFACFKEIKVQ